MKFKSALLPFAISAALFVSCQGSADAEGEQGTSTPIDSTNQNGTAPATYGGDNPANDQDTTYRNSSDTGTRVSNGPDNTKDINSTNNQSR